MNSLNTFIIKLLIIVLSYMCTPSLWAQQCISGIDFSKNVPTRLLKKIPFKDLTLEEYQNHAISQNIKLTIYKAFDDLKNCTFLLVTTNKSGEIVDFIQTSYFEDKTYNYDFNCRWHDTGLRIYDKEIKVKLYPNYEDREALKAHIGYNSQHPTIKDNIVTVYTKYLIGFEKTGLNIAEYFTNDANCDDYFDSYVISNSSSKYSISTKGYFKFVKTTTFANDIAQFNKKFNTYWQHGETGFLSEIAITTFFKSHV